MMGLVAVKLVFERSNYAGFSDPTFHGCWQDTVSCTCAEVSVSSKVVA